MVGQAPIDKEKCSNHMGSLIFIHYLCCVQSCAKNEKENIR